MPPWFLVWFGEIWGLRLTIKPIKRRKLHLVAAFFNRNPRGTQTRGRLDVSCTLRGYGVGNTIRRLGSMKIYKRRTKVCKFENFQTFRDILHSVAGFSGVLYFRFSAARTFVFSCPNTNLKLSMLCTGLSAGHSVLVRAISRHWRCQTYRPRFGERTRSKFIILQSPNISLF